MSEKLTKQKAKKIDKPWGYELVWAHTDQYVGKVLFIKAGESLSLQYHEQKEETIFLEQGEMNFESGPSVEELESTILNPGDIFHITPGYVHRMTAQTDCRIFEVSTPQLEDVVRLEDRYGRAQQ